MRSHGFPKIVAVVVGASLLAFGLWALVSPTSFVDAVASFDPYNQHFVQDIGAFQIGLGAVLLLAAFVSSDALTVALLGVGIGSSAHVASHLVGRDLGGKPATDIPFFLLMSALLLAAGVVRKRG
ncbi:MAG TPA: hypothetical protein VMY34_05650 [Acidimicrobiales bacterium]|nr:hypothetical protein [Acidimicrobiales bacterium]